MSGETAFSQWANWLEQRLQAMEERQQELEEDNRQLKEQIAAIEPARYGNITYKIQELHVNELKGTLNIGLTSQADEGQIQDMISHMKMEFASTENEQGPD